ncbi:MAG: helix-turn-helix domain-containing protein [Lachnospiraceae bacterium]|nr:helix-turn-helix domain-containing protein [Lachnospiraceae bacterium]
MKVMNSVLSDDIYISLEETVEAGSFPVYHSHNVYEIYILAEGKRSMFIGNKLYDISVGDAAMIKPQIPHRSFGKIAYKGICIEFTERYIASKWDKLWQDRIKNCFNDNVIMLDAEQLKDMWQKAELVVKKELDKKLYFEELIYVLDKQRIEQKCRQELQYCTSMSTLNGNQVESDASPIGTYIQDNYMVINSLDEISAHFEISKSYLCRLFKKQTGITIIEYINRLKVQYAYKLLQETDMAINEISHAVGFETVIYFNRIFKKVMGATPGEARRKARENWTYITED